jgi:transmembrane sensor
MAREPSRPVSERALAEAATWVVTLHGPGRDAALESGWRSWVAEDPDHAFAWELTSGTWTETHEVPTHLVLPLVPARGKPLRDRLVRAAVAVGACGLIVVGWGLHLLDRPDVVTGVGEQRSLTLRDGTRVELNTNSRLLLQYDEHARRVVLKSGEAFFSVAHQVRPFVVMVGKRKVIAMGTSFMVRRDEQSEDSVTVTLLEGRLAVAPATAADVLATQALPQVTVLSSGQRFRVRRDAEPTVDAPPMDRATGWMRGQVNFDHTPLAQAAAELNRYSTIRISVTSAAAQIAIGGIFRAGDSESFARAVAESYNLRLVRIGDQLLLEAEQGNSLSQGPSQPDP